MIVVVLLIALGLLMFAPQWWVRHVMRKYGDDIAEMPGTGGELAEHLIERFQLSGITVEETEEFGDHFDPKDRKVRLSPSNYQGRSLKAVAVAAHEVGHAIQFHRQEAVFRLRSRYLPLAEQMRRLGVAVLWLSPLLGLVMKSPLAFMLPILISVGMQVIAALTYLIVLPEEWDASFGKAMPILAEGYVPESWLPHAETVLKAAAFTYFAAALSSVLNLGYLLLLLRR
ncbi:MAG: zinc metallopeptidase [Thiolinea sp.]